jgi:hypothetical protein
LLRFIGIVEFKNNIVDAFNTFLDAPIKALNMTMPRIEPVVIAKKPVEKYTLIKHNQRPRLTKS